MFCYFLLRICYVEKIKVLYLHSKEYKDKINRVFSIFAMSVRKDLRADNTYMFPSNEADNPKLGARLLSDGRESLFLDYYLGYKKDVSERTGKAVVKVDRKRESLKLYLWTAPRTAKEREQNRETLELAKKIRYEREQELKEGMLGYRLKKGRVTNFLDYFQAYIDNYTKKDIRMLQMALRRFKDFLRDTPAYCNYQNSIKPERVTREMVLAFTEYLKGRSKGDGAKTIYARFKKVVLHAVRQGVMPKNPCEGIVVKADDKVLRKDVLSVEEIETLAATHCRNENPNVRRAFLFCCYAGLRYCDVKALTYKNVDYANRLLCFEQSKTKVHSVNSGVTIPLNDELLELIGQPAGGDRDGLIFPLPSNTMCLKALRHWVENAGIDKHITWHCARHSFAVNILNEGANIKTVASLLGHSGIAETEKYTRAVDSLKRAAIESLHRKRPEGQG